MAGLDAVRIESNGACVRVAGDLDLASAGEALRRVNGVFAAGEDELVFDLAELGRCDSAGLAVLLEWRRAARRHGRELTYRNVPERLRKLASISDVEGVLGFPAG